MSYQLNDGLIEYAIQQSKTLTIKSGSYLSRERKCIDGILCQYLHEVGLDNYQNQIAYCLHELGGNAHKANLKRACFHCQGLDIDNPNDYRKGMNRFKEETLHGIDKLQKIIREIGLYLKIEFKLCQSDLKIRIKNNTRIKTEELKKIQAKFKADSEYSCMTDALDEIEDESEGAGLGIMMILQLLKNLGFPQNCLNVYCCDEAEETIAELQLNIELIGTAV